MASTPSASAVDSIMGGEGAPEMLSRPRGSNPAPLSGDVLRAYDAYHVSLTEAAGVAAPGPLIDDLEDLLGSYHVHHINRI